MNKIWVLGKQLASCSIPWSCDHCQLYELASHKKTQWESQQGRSLIALVSLYPTASWPVFSLIAQCAFAHLFTCTYLSPPFLCSHMHTFTSGLFSWTPLGKHICMHWQVIFFSGPFCDSRQAHINQSLIFQPPSSTHMHWPPLFPAFLQCRHAHMHSCTLSPLLWPLYAHIYRCAVLFPQPSYTCTRPNIHFPQILWAHAQLRCGLHQASEGLPKPPVTSASHLIICLSWGYNHNWDCLDCYC